MLRSKEVRQPAVNIMDAIVGTGDVTFVLSAFALGFDLGVNYQESKQLDEMCDMQEEDR